VAARVAKVITVGVELKRCDKRLRPTPASAAIAAELARYLPAVNQSINQDILR